MTGKNNPLFFDGQIMLGLFSFNIIEQNTIGGVYLNYTNLSSTPMGFQMRNSYIANHPLFDIYNGVFTDANAFADYNDFAGSPLLAYDIGSNINWNRNWWSDYSPGCVNANNDLWCDVNRPIPVANQDVQPKAGAPWGNNARGYLPLDQGMMLSQCYIPMIPQYPVRPINPGGGGSNNNETTQSDG